MASSLEVSESDEAENTSREPSPTVDAFEAFTDEEELVSSDDEAEKDDVEKELEGLVFGDDAGFKARLKAYKAKQDLEGDDDDYDALHEQEGRALATVDDADLFFLDAGADAPLPAQPDAIDTTTQTMKHRRPPAWEDSEDERMMISLMSVPRLRKLRHYEGEDVISGKEYSRRLRQQFEILNPRPKWANWNSHEMPKRHRRGSTGAESSASDASSTEDMDNSDSEMSTQPLARLLQSNESLIRSSGNIRNKRRKIQPEVISVERMKDIQPTQPSAITCLSIHPSMPLLLSAGPSSTLYLHHLIPHPVPPDPPNPLITSLHLKNTPITTAAFSSEPSPTVGGPKIFLSSRRRYFHVWDLPTGTIRKITRVYGHSEEQRSMEILRPSPCGRYLALKGSSRKGGGVVNVLDATTLQWVSQVRVESQKGVGDFAWWRDGNGMTVVGRGGEVNEWSVQDGAIVARWQDEGAIGTTTVALGGERNISSALGTDRWVAVGSTAGIVNIYDRGPWMDLKDASVPANPQPTKTFDHLTTPISHLSFSPCGQLLAMASRWKRDALRLVHLPSCTVFRNWPTAKTPLGRISALALGEYQMGEGDDATKTLVLAVGNEAGSLRAWELGG